MYTFEIQRREIQRKEIIIGLPDYSDDYWSKKPCVH